jgi:hypothetical protein
MSEVVYVAYKPPSSAFGTFSPRKKRGGRRALDETLWQEIQVGYERSAAGDREEDAA